MKLLRGVRYILPGTQVAQVHKMKAAEVNIATPTEGKLGHNSEGLGPWGVEEGKGLQRPQL